MARLCRGGWLKTYLEYTEHTEAPITFHYWTAVGTIAAALQRKVWIDQEHFHWVPNFYIILIAPPGLLNKSTTLHIGKRLATELKSVRFGPSALTWQAMIQSLQKANEIVIMPDGTLYPMSCLTFYVSELGTLLDPHDRQLVDVLVDLWDGQLGVWEKATKMFGSEAVPNPWLNIMAGTTPSWLADNLPRAMVGGGFTSRCVFIFGNEKRHLVAYPKRQISPAQQAVLRGHLLHDLEEIAMLKGEFIITDEAYVWGEQWYADHYKVMKANVNSRPEVSGYLSRKQTHIHKLAMVLSASETDSMQIEKHHLEIAARITDSVEADLPQIFKYINSNTTMEAVGYLCREIQAKGKVPKQDLYRLFFSTMTPMDFEQALTAAILAGYASVEVYGTQTFIVWSGKDFDISGKAASTAWKVATL